MKWVKEQKIEHGLRKLGIKFDTSSVWPRCVSSSSAKLRVCLPTSLRLIADVKQAETELAKLAVLHRWEGVIDKRATPAAVTVPHRQPIRDKAIKIVSSFSRLLEEYNTCKAFVRLVLNTIGEFLRKPGATIHCKIDPCEKESLQEVFNTQ